MHTTSASIIACAITAMLTGCATFEGDLPRENQFTTVVDNRDVIVCKRVATGTRVRKSLCLTQHEWDRLRRESLEYLVRNDDEVRR